MFWSVLLIDAIFLIFLFVGPDIIKDDKDMALKYRKKKMQAAAQVEAMDKEQTESSSSGHQVQLPFSFS